MRSLTALVNMANVAGLSSTVVSNANKVSPSAQHHPIPYRLTPLRETVMHLVSRAKLHIECDYFAWQMLAIRQIREGIQHASPLQLVRWTKRGCGQHRAMPGMDGAILQYVTLSRVLRQRALPRMSRQLARLGDAGWSQIFWKYGFSRAHKSTP